MLKNMIKNKLNSESGATLMLALLFFILCAVVGSIILTSGTAVSGRLKSIKTDDREYYAVSSAARYFSETIQDSTFTVSDSRAENDEGEKTYTFGSLLQDGEEGDSLIYSMLSECFDDYFSSDSADNIKWKNKLEYMGTEIAEKTYTVSAGDYDQLKVNCAVSMNEFGDINILISKTDGTYKLLFTAEPSIEERIETSSGTEARGYSSNKITTIKYEKDNIRIRKVN